MKRANSSQRQTIETVFGNGEADATAITAACDALRDCGAKEACEKQMTTLVEEFIEGLDNDRYRTESKQFFIDTARYIVERNN